METDVDRNERGIGDNFGCLMVGKAIVRVVGYTCYAAPAHFASRTFQEGRKLFGEVFLGREYEEFFNRDSSFLRYRIK